MNLNNCGICENGAAPRVCEKVENGGERGREAEREKAKGEREKLWPSIRYTILRSSSRIHRNGRCDTRYARPRILSEKWNERENIVTGCSHGTAAHSTQCVFITFNRRWTKWYIRNSQTKRYEEVVATTTAVIRSTVPENDTTEKDT